MQRIRMEYETEFTELTKLKFYLHEILLIQQYDLAGKIIGLVMKVHSTLGSGFLESIYKRALTVELQPAGIAFDYERTLEVFYNENLVGRFFADIIVENQLIIAIKAVQNLVKAHEVQLVNYLTATGIEQGLLLNFGTASLQFKKKFRVYRKTTRE